MPLEIRKSVTNDISWAIWHINERLEELVESWSLSEFDRDYLDKVTHQRKKKEYLAGRLVIRHLAQEMKLDFSGIYKDEWGKPHLINTNHQVSISNSYPYAAAIINGKDPVGIDLEIPSPKLVKIAPKFLNEEELEFSKNDPEKLCVLWCAKEALYKIFGRKRLIFKENLKVSPFQCEKEGVLQGQILIGNSNQEYKLHYELWNDYIICHNV